MVEALEKNISAAAALNQDDEDLLSGVTVPEASPATKAATVVDLNDSYEETQMNPNGFFNECNDQVSYTKRPSSPPHSINLPLIIDRRQQ